MNVAFNCSIVPVSKSFGDAHQILQIAEKGLRDAQQKGPAPVKLVVNMPQGERNEKKEVVLIDTDEELLRILRTAFESHDLAVKTFTEGIPALNDILSNGESRLPALIIVERKLPDMDGLDLFDRLKARFRVPIPLFFLTVFSSDKDVSEGLSHGALQYVTKPFNLSLLVQRALAAIFKNKFPS